MTIKKILALALSAAVVASAAIIPSFKSTAATLTPDDDMSSAGMNGSGTLVTTGIDTFGNATDLWGLQQGISGSYDSIAADTLAKTITFKNFNAGHLSGVSAHLQSELYIGGGSDGYTYIFDGDCSFQNFDINGAHITLSLTPGSTLSLAGYSTYWNDFITLSGGTIANPYPFVNNQPLTFSGAGEDEEDNEAEDEDAEDEEVFVLTQEMIDEILKYFSALEYQNRLNGFENNLLQAAYNATPASPQVLYFSEGDALPLEVFGILKTNPNVSIVFHYTYKGQTYQLWISGAQAAKYYNENIKWYGPELLASMFPADTSGLFNFN